MLWGGGGGPATFGESGADVLAGDSACRRPGFDVGEVVVEDDGARGAHVDVGGGPAAAGPGDEDGDPADGAPHLHGDRSRRRGGQ